MADRGHPVLGHLPETGGEWFFERRKLHRWYIGDALTRPAHGLGVGGEGLRTLQLPEAFETWATFWAAQAG